MRALSLSRWSALALACSLSSAFCVSGCGGGGSGGGGGSEGGATSSGGAGASNNPSGGSAMGGATTGGSSTSSGGMSGASSGGMSTGGASGATSGGATSGGAPASGGSGGSSNGAGTSGGGSKSSGGSSNGGTAGSAAGGSTSNGCLDFGAPSKAGSIEATALAGPSGMVASRAHAGVLYAHLDAGGTATVYAMTTAGKALGEYAIMGAMATDWEDIAVGPGKSGGNFIYIGDIGDNAARMGGTTRTEIQVYRVPEPDVSPTQADAKMTLTGTEVLRFTYPDMAHDAETLMVDPTNGDILIVTKETDGNSSIFRAPASTPVDTATKLEKVGTVKIGASGQAAQASAGDISPTGDRFMIRSYTAILLWPRAATLADTFAAMPTSIAWSTEKQGEGVTFSADGKSIFLAGEQDRSLFQSMANCP